MVNNGYQILVNRKNILLYLSMSSLYKQTCDKRKSCMFDVMFVKMLVTDFHAYPNVSQQKYSISIIYR